MANVGTNLEIIYSLEQIIRQYNLFAMSYVMMKEEFEQQRELLGSDTEPELQLIFSLKPDYDQNRYNLQKTNEVAAVFLTTTNGDHIPESYVTIRNKVNHLLQSVSSMDSIHRFILMDCNVGIKIKRKSRIGHFVAWEVKGYNSAWRVRRLELGSARKKVTTRLSV